MGAKIAATLAIIAIMVAGWAYGEELRWHARFNTLAADHPLARMIDIRAALRKAEHRPVIVILGDSITEHVRFPEIDGGRIVINAGVSGASIEQMRRMVPMLFEGAPHPAACVVALGMNDRDRVADVAESYGRLLAELRPICPDVVSIAVTPAKGADAVNAEIRQAADAAGIPFVETGMPAETRDGVHLNEAGYAVWMPAVLADAQKAARP